MSRKMSKITIAFVLFLVTVVCANAQGLTTAPAPAPAPAQRGNGISLAPARLELEMQPGSETTVVVNLDYHTSAENSQPAGSPFPKGKSRMPYGGPWVISTSVSSGIRLQ